MQRPQRRRSSHRFARSRRLPSALRQRDIWDNVFDSLSIMPISKGGANSLNQRLSTRWFVHEKVDKLKQMHLAKELSVPGYPDSSGEIPPSLLTQSPEDTVFFYVISDGTCSRVSADKRATHFLKFRISAVSHAPTSAKIIQTRSL